MSKEAATSIHGLSKHKNSSGNISIIVLFLALAAIFLTVGLVVYKTSRPQADMPIKIADTTIKSEDKTQYERIMTDATKQMTYKFPVGAFGEYKGIIEIWPGRHHKDYDTKYREVMSSFLSVNSARNYETFVFQKPFMIGGKYEEKYLPHLDETKITFLYSDNNLSNMVKNTWETLPTTLNTQTNIAITTGTKTGNYVMVAPLTCPEDTIEYNDDFDFAESIGEVDKIWEGPGKAPRMQGIPFGQKLPIIFDIKEDQEWYKFEAKRDKTYVFELSELGTNVKANIELYEDSGVTKIPDFVSTNEWKAPDAYLGTNSYRGVFVRIVPTENSAIGCEAKLNFILKEK